MQKTPWLSSNLGAQVRTPNLPTKITSAKIRWLKLSGKVPMDMRIPPLRIKILLESNPLKSIILVRRLAVAEERRGVIRTYVRSK